MVPFLTLCCDTTSNLISLSHSQVISFCVLSLIFICLFIYNYYYYYYYYYYCCCCCCYYYYYHQYHNSLLSSVFSFCLLLSISGIFNSVLATMPQHTYFFPTCLNVPFLVMFFVFFTQYDQISSVESDSITS